MHDQVKSDLTCSSVAPRDETGARRPRCSGPRSPARRPASAATPRAGPHARSPRDPFSPSWACSPRIAPAVRKRRHLRAPRSPSVVRPHRTEDLWTIQRMRDHSHARLTATGTTATTNADTTLPDPLQRMYVSKPTSMHPNSTRPIARPAFPAASASSRSPLIRPTLKPFPVSLPDMPSHCLHHGERRSVHPPQNPPPPATTGSTPAPRAAFQSSFGSAPKHLCKCRGDYPINGREVRQFS